MEKRQPLRCNKCGKTRILSPKEANEDGWKIELNTGVVCDKCQDKYGIPSTFFRKSSFVGLCETKEGIGIIAEWEDANINRTIE